jgi:rSAM/selenodomain-associated transferase 1
MWRLRLAYWRGADVRDLARRYYRTLPPAAATLQIFAKPPLPGRVKTRLAASIGDQAAAEVYRRLVQCTLDTASAARRAGIVGEVEVWAAPGDSPDALAAWSDRHGFALRTQQGDDLGARMHHALRDALTRNAPALLIGTDVPGYDVAYLAAAAAALQHGDAVVGPAEDGGYVLVGLARDVDVFTGVPWSTPGVMAATRAKLSSAGVDWRELPALWDVDTQDDLARWVEESESCRYLAATSHAGVAASCAFAPATFTTSGSRTPFFTAVISASIEMAISGGVRLPM